MSRLRKGKFIMSTLRSWVQRFLRVARHVRFFSYRWRLYAAAEQALAGFHGRVLDIGAGQQPFRPYLPSDARYTALEIVPIPGNDVIASVLALPFANGAFDAVICTEVLEHVPEPGHALAEIHRVLRDGGQVYITVPMTWGHHYVPHDYYRYTRYGLTYLLEKGGFRVVRVYQIGGLFTAMLARVQDLLGLGIFRLAYPVKFLGGNATRLFVTTLLLLPFFVLLDFLAALLDRTIPGARRDALGWSVLAVRATHSA